MAKIRTFAIEAAWQDLLSYLGCCTLKCNTNLIQRNIGNQKREILLLEFWIWNKIQGQREQTLVICLLILICTRGGWKRLSTLIQASYCAGNEIAAEERLKFHFWARLIFSMVVSWRILSAGVKTEETLPEAQRTQGIDFVSCVISKVEMKTSCRDYSR